MKRWRILLVGATALACISCGAAVISGQTSTTPTMVRGASVTNVERPVSTQDESSAAAGAVTAQPNPQRPPSTMVKQPVQSQLPPKTAINPQPAQNLPAPIVNPCRRAGKPVPMCAVTAP